VSAVVEAGVRLSLPSLLTGVTEVTKILQRAKDALSACRELVLVDHQSLGGTVRKFADYSTSPCTRRRSGSLGLPHVKIWSDALPGMGKSSDSLCAFLSHRLIDTDAAAVTTPANLSPWNLGDTWHQAQEPACHIEPFHLPTTEPAQ
jgi:hypothetical protein